MSVDVSPDGATLLFDLLGDIYAVSATGGEARLIHGGPALQVMPRFSRDGQRMLYLSDASGSDNLWISGVDGTDPIQVTHETVDLVTTPVWGPGEEYFIAAKTYAQASETGSSELRMYHREGGQGRLVVAKPSNGTSVFEPELSADGRYLYYTERIAAPHQSHIFIDPNHIHFAVMRRDLQDGSTERLVAGFGGATTPRLSPDGSRFAFIRRVKEKTVLFIYDLDTGAQRPIYDRLDRDAQASFIPQGTYYPRFSWFPDGRHLAIWAGGQLKRIDTASGEARLIPIRVATLHTMVRAPRFEIELAPDMFAVRAIEQIAMAPARDALTFTALGRIWVQSLPDGEPRRLTEGSVVETDPAYSPDGRSIAWVQADGAGRGTLKVRHGRGPTRTVVSSEGILRQPAFSPDGQSLVYAVAEGDKCTGGFGGEPGIYIVSVNGGEPRRLSRSTGWPQFSPDGQRVFIAFDNLGQAGIDSIDRSGQDRRSHVQASGADISTLRLSPDHRWLAFKDRQQFWLMPFLESGKPLILDSGDEVGRVALSRVGGYGLSWSADARALHWTVGATVHTASLDDDTSTRPSWVGSEFPLALEAAGDAPQGLLALVNARLITLQEAGVIEQGTILVEGRRIAALGPMESVEIPPGTKVLDVQGMTIMPGLVDMHGHIDNCYYSNSGLMPQSQASHYAALAFGVTTNYDPYTSDLPALAIGEMRLAGMSVGPRLVTTGLPFFGRSGRGDGAFVAIRTFEDAMHAVALKASLGAPVVKSYKQPMRSQRQKVVEAARAQSIMVDAEGESHFYFNVSMILDGHTALEHNFPVATYYDDLVQLMAHGETAYTPTLVVLFGEQIGENFLYQSTRSWEDSRIRAFVPETTSGYSAIPTPYSAPLHVRNMTTIHVADELWDIGIRSVARSMKALDDAGVLVNAGSHGQVDGLAMHWEMWLLAEGGMANDRVLRAATINGAKTLGLDAQIGTLEPGKLADLLVLERNPLEDIRNTTSARWVMVNGRLYDALRMDEVGNYDRPRPAFFWESAMTEDPDWNPAWSRE